MSPVAAGGVALSWHCDVEVRTETDPVLDGDNGPVGGAAENAELRAETNTHTVGHVVHGDCALMGEAAVSHAPSKAVRRRVHRERASARRGVRWVATEHEQAGDAQRAEPAHHRRLMA